MDSVTVYMWGRNPNTTLGHDRSREHPERLDLALPRNTRVVQVSFLQHQEREELNTMRHGQKDVCTWVW